MNNDRMFTRSLFKEGQLWMEYDPSGGRGDFKPIDGLAWRAPDRIFSLDGRGERYTAGY